MAFQQTTCPHCREQIQVPTDREAVKCMFCGGEVQVAHALRRGSGPRVAGLMRLATTAAQAGNFVEAYQYFSQVLELDDRSTDAWLGKARAAGWQSTLSNIRFREMIVLSDQAVESAVPEERGAVAAQAATAVTEVVFATWQLAAGHHNRNAAPHFPEQQTRLNNELVGWAAQCFDALNAAIDIVEREHVEEHPIYERYFSIAKGFFSFGLAPELQAAVQTTLRKHLHRARKSDPHLVVPEQKSSVCFVATVVYGTPTHPHVALLRQYRDVKLVRSTCGRAAIAAYYIAGPIAARLLKGSPFLIRVIRRFLTEPAARRILNQSDQR